MREGLDGDGFIGMVRGDVLENLLWFQGSTILRSTVNTAVAIRIIVAHLIVAQQPHAWCLVKLVVGDHNVVRSDLQNVPLGTLGCPD